MSLSFARISSIAFYAIFFLISSSQFSFAQILDSSFYDWSVYEFFNEESEEKECYIVSHPKKFTSSYANRQKPYIMITRFENSRTEEASIYSGYEYKLNSEISVLVDGYYQKLFAKTDIAWAKTKEDDVQLIQKMLLSSKIFVRSDASIGGYAVDEYSAKGITKAYSRMREVCR